jgi:hypothetical protein
VHHLAGRRLFPGPVHAPDGEITTPKPRDKDSRMPDRLRDRMVRIPLDIIVTRPHTRGQHWTAEAGHWRTEGVTERGTLADLTADLGAYLRDYRDPQIVAFRGHTGVVWLDRGCPPIWNRRVINPSGAISSSSHAAGDWETAVADTRYDLAQRTTDFHDDASVHEAAAYLAAAPPASDGSRGPDELYDHARWQRAAKTAIDAGRDDWHEWATAHRAEFAIPAPSATRPTGSSR